jgi:hypothetical protein
MSKTDLLLSEYDWTLLNGLIEILQPCDAITKELSSESHATFSKVTVKSFFPSQLIKRKCVLGYSNDPNC